MASALLALVGMTHSDAMSLDDLTMANAAIEKADRMIVVAGATGGSGTWWIEE